MHLFSFISVGETADHQFFFFFLRAGGDFFLFPLLFPPLFPKTTPLLPPPERDKRRRRLLSFFFFFPLVQQRVGASPSFPPFLGPTSAPDGTRARVHRFFSFFFFFFFFPGHFNSRVHFRPPLLTFLLSRTSLSPFFPPDWRQRLPALSFFFPVFLVFLLCSGNVEPFSPFSDYRGRQTSLLLSPR